MLMGFDPFRDFDRLADSALGWSRAATRGAMGMDAWRGEDHVTLRFDLPGVDPDSIDITVEKHQLRVQAERKWDREEGMQVLAAERPHGTFSRSIFLGDGLDLDAIEASYDHGVLTLTVPVAEQAKPRRISVGSGQQALAS